MELDSLEEKENWNSSKLKLVAIITIVVSSLIALFLLIGIFQVEELADQIEQALEKQGNEEVGVDTVMSIMRTVFVIMMIPFILSAIGSGMIMKKSESGWILLLIAHVIIILFMFLSLLGGPSPLGIILLGGYITLTILINKFRYKKQEQFEDYSN
ncbi:MAG: hypothetical protein R2799_14030 [Crocinitomicaceae bacterium]